MLCDQLLHIQTKTNQDPFSELNTDRDWPET